MRLDNFDRVPFILFVSSVCKGEFHDSLRWVFVALLYIPPCNELNSTNLSTCFSFPHLWFELGLFVGNDMLNCRHYHRGSAFRSALLCTDSVQYLGTQATRFTAVCAASSPKYSSRTEYFPLFLSYSPALKLSASGPPAIRQPFGNCPSTIPSPRSLRVVCSIANLDSFGQVHFARVWGGEPQIPHAGFTAHRYNTL